MASHPLYAVRDYDAAVGTDSFSVPFPYINRAHVLVWVDDYPVNFTWLTDSTIKLDRPLIQDATVRIKRRTPLNLRLVDFQSANLLTEKDLDVSALQLFYIQQETQDDLELGLIGNPDAVPIKGDRGDFYEQRYTWSLTRPEQPDAFDPQPEGWSTDMGEKPDAGYHLYMIKCLKDGLLGTCVTDWTEAVRLTGDDGYGANPESPSWPYDILISASDTAVIITWGTPSFEGYLNTKVYRMVWDGTSDYVFNEGLEYSSGVGNYMDTNVESGQWYVYWLRHVNNKGEMSDYSAALPIQVRTPLDLREGWIRRENFEEELAAAITLDYSALNAATGLADSARETAERAAANAAAAQATTEAAIATASQVLLDAEGYAATAFSEAERAQSTADKAVLDAATAIATAEQARDTAITAKDRAIEEAGLAEQARGAAVIASTDASGYAQAALVSKNTATNAARDAESHASAAVIAATGADGSAQAALVAQTTTEQLASGAADAAAVAVTNAEAAVSAATAADGSATAAMSASTESKNYSDQAATSATAAVTAATAADGSASAALAAKTEAVDASGQARTSAQAAASAATDADGSATAALTAKTEATNAATNASLSAQAAVTAATEADGSAQAALTAKTDALDHANNAQVSAESAVSAATAADGSAAAALTAKTEAAQSAQAAVLAQTAADGSAAAALTAKTAAEQAVTDAEGHSGSASLSAQAAASAATAADGSATAAIAAKTQAQQAVTDAEGHASSASLAAQAAATAQTGADGSATAALTAQTLAETAATTAEGHASSASLSAQAAATAQTLADGSAQAALTAKTKAEQAVTDAEGHATTASQEAAAAVLAKTDASGYASSALVASSTATTQAGNAADSADEASASAATAAGHAATATTKANAAVTAETNASGYAASALVAQSKAEQAVTDAQGHVTTASKHATAASKSATDASGYASSSLAAQTTTVAARDAAVSARDAANTAKTGAVNAKNAAVTAKNDAVTAKDAAVAAKVIAEQKATAAVNASTDADGYAQVALTAQSEATTASTSAESYKNSALSYRNSANAHKKDAAASATSASEYAAQSLQQANVALQAATKAGESAELVAQVSLVQGIIMDVWEGTVSVPASTTYAGAHKLQLYSDMTGKAALRVKIKDAEGGVRIALNGAEIGTELRGANNEIKWYEFVADVVEGNNELAVWAATSDGSTLMRAELRGGDADTKYSAVEERLRATEDEAFYSIKVDRDGKVAGIGLVSDPLGTAILFSADQIGFQNDTGAPILPFAVRNGIVYMDNARVSLLEANSIVNIDDVDGNEKRAHLGNTFIEGRLAIGKSGQILWKDLDPEFRDRLVMRANDSVLKGGTRVNTTKLIDFDVGTILYAARSGDTLNPPIESGGRSAQLTVNIQQHNRGWVELDAPYVSYTAHRKNINTGAIDNLGSGIHTGTTFRDDGNMFVTKMDFVKVFQCPLPTAGHDYEYWIKLHDKRTLFAGATCTIEAREEVSSSDNLVVNTDWNLIQNKPAMATRWAKWTEVSGKPTSFTPSSHTHAWAQVTGAPATATRWPKWTEVSDKPTSFTPSSHTHAWAQVTGAPATATRWPSFSEVTSKPATATRWPSFSEVTGKPSTYAPSAHDHNYLVAVDDRDVKPSTTSTNGKKAVKAFFTSLGGMTGTANSDYQDLLVLDTYSDSSGGSINALAFDKSTKKITHYLGGYGATTWGSGSVLSYEGHTHAWSTITDKPTTFTPSSHAHAWSTITGKPTTFTPSSHSHAWSQITGAPATATRWPSFSEVTGKPSTFTPSSHTHAWSQITGAPATATRWPSFSEVTGKPSTYAPSAHSHSWNDIDGASQNSWGGLRTSTSHGYIEFGPANTNYAHIYTDMPGFYLNKPLYENNGGRVFSTKRLPSWSEVASKPATATRWPSWSEVTSKPTVTEQDKAAGTVSTAGWYTIAEGSARTYGRFTISDASSGRHNIVTIIAAGAYGYHSVQSIDGLRYSKEAIRHVRILYNTSDRTYGIYKLQVYCVNPSYSLNVVQHKDAANVNGWDNWSLTGAKLEDTPSGWAQDDTARLDNITGQDGRSVLSKLYVQQDLFSKGHRVLTYGDLQPDTPPPAGLENTITADWLSAGVVQANLVASGGLNVSSGSGSSRRTFLFQPEAKRPMHFFQGDLGTTGQKDLFYVDAEGGGYFKGGLAPNTVDAQAIDVSAKQAIYPHYLSDGEKYVNDSLNIVRGTGSAQTTSSFSTLVKGDKVSIRARVSDNYATLGTATKYTNSTYTLQVQRQHGSSSGSWSNIGSPVTVVVNGWWHDAYVEYEGGGRGDYYERPDEIRYPARSGYYYNGEIAVTDTLSVTSGYVRYRVLVTRTVSGTGTSGGLRFRYLGAVKSSFKSNELKSSSGVHQHIDKETGFVIITAQHNFGKTKGTKTFSFPQKLTEVYGCSLGVDWATDTDGRRVQPRYRSLTTSGVTVYNAEDALTNNTVSITVTGRIAV